MNTTIIRHPALLTVVVLVIIAAAIAVIKKDTIADLLLRGGDVSLTHEPARNSPQAKLAIDFLGAVRTMNKDAIARLGTAEQITRMQQETQQPSEDMQKMRAMMLDDLPADPAVLRSRIKSVQTHGNLAVVTFETKANSWFVQLAQVNGAWKVSGF